MNDTPPIGARQPGGKPRGAFTEKLLSPKIILGVLITALAVWFVLANNTQTRVHFWVVWVTAKLWMVLAGTFVAGLLAGYLLKRRTVVKKEP
jgi:uncharacterized integral membrane protein